MRKIAFILLLLIETNAFAFNILDAFQTMPEHLTPTLNAILKSELINSYINGSDSVENQYAGKSKINLLDTDNDLLQIQTSAVGRMELKLFAPTPKDTIIGYINTVCTPTCSSCIKIFNLKWEELPLTTIDYNAFCKNIDTEQWLLFKSWDVPQFIEYTFTDGNTIKAMFNTFSYLDSEQQKQIEPIIKKSLKLGIKPQASNSRSYILTAKP